jgi:SepF-like predicted cell division protein (DUF552 family)
MPFNLFRKKKETEQKTLAVPTQETPQEKPAQEAPPQPTPAVVPEPVVPVEEPTPKSTPQPEVAVEEQPQEQQPQEQPQETSVEEAPASAPTQELPQEQPAGTQPEEEKPAPIEPANKTYLKAMPLKELADIENVKNEVRNGNIIILRITPLAGKSIEDVKTAVNDLFAFAESIGGDIARLGEERVVVCPKTIRIWREKTPAPVSNNQTVPTVA